MRFILLLTLVSFHIADAASNQVGPVKPGNPNEFVAQVFANMLESGVTLATELNDSKAPIGDINKPYEQIGGSGYLKYVEEHPEMINDSKPFIRSVNEDKATQHAWQIVKRSRDKSLNAREKALKLYYSAANVPLAKEEKEVIPKLKLAPFMVGIMLANQKLGLDDKQKKVWNAIFASTASILQAMETQDKEAFSALFEKHLPDRSCCLQ